MRHVIHKARNHILSQYDLTSMLRPILAVSLELTHDLEYSGFSGLVQLYLSKGCRESWGRNERGQFSKGGTVLCDGTFGTYC